MGLHYFKFSTNWQAKKRLCGDCGRTYADGEHIEVSVIKPFTSYICPDAGNDSTGHSSTWSGAQNVPELKSPDDDKCLCGKTYIEEDSETWTVTWEMEQAGSWQPVSNTGSRHSTSQQHRGLLELIEQGDPIRNVRLERS